MNEIFIFLKRFEKITRNTDLMVAVGLFAILAVMIVPLPPFLLDFFLTVSLSLSILILLVSIYVSKALEFSVFPSLLLISTLFRLSLNVATTRIILSHGHEGGAAAGEVIHAFGDFVIGSNYVIGLVVFVILVVINFIVITKGSGRVAEVAARFTLDSMPGKQMAIDADLSAGLITEEEARRRRSEVEQEADFYGAMDGASKFVRGDAIAGIIITIVNVVGGLLIGVLQKGIDLSTAAKYYTMLTVGDGLIAQIPALIISTAAGIVVTRSSRNGKNMGEEISAQLFLKPRALYVASGMIGFLAIIPGMPKLPFLIMAAAIAVVAWVVDKYQKEEVAEKKRKEEEISMGPKKENIESLLPLDVVELEIGYGLISVVESEQSGDLLERIASIRKQFALDLGIVV
ncbi:MAG: FHIPEP family type III secretion protein, partial [Pseudobdellovibrionaceae bacterium]